MDWSLFSRPPQRQHTSNAKSFSAAISGEYIPFYPDYFNGFFTGEFGVQLP